jgi:hypothetical protein
MPDPIRHHGVILRYEVRGASGLPPTVVVKAHRDWLLDDAVGADGWNRRFNPDARLFPVPRDRFRQEVAGLRFMQQLPAPVAAPRLYAQDAFCQCAVMEDLGSHDTVLEPLLSSDSAAGADALLGMARGMARLHGASVGHEGLLANCGSELRPADADWALFHDGLHRCVELARARGIDLPGGLRADVGRVRDYFTQDDACLVFSPGDIGPGNQFLINNEITLFDFEYSRFRHFALEFSNLLLSFPVVYTSSAYPKELTEELIDVYFREAGEVIGALSWTERARASRFGTAWWTFASVGADLDEAISQDYQWGFATCRERHLHKLALLASITNDDPELRALGEFADRLFTDLSPAWGHMGSLPLYPAFRKS